MRNVPIFSLIFISLLSCKSDEFKYEYVLFDNGNIRFWRDQIESEYRDKIEDGDFLIDSAEGDTLKAGKFRDGFKIGKWKYYPSSNHQVYVDWLIYLSNGKSIEINYPKGWKVLESNSLLFQATFPSKSSVKDDKFFIILEQSKKKLGIDLKEYWELSNVETHSSDTVESHLLRMFSREDGNYYFSTYTILRNGERVFIMNFLGETDTMIYDITYSSLKDDNDKNYIIFLDMIQSLRIEERRFFTPFDQSTKIIELEWPARSANIS